MKPRSLVMNYDFDGSGANDIELELTFAIYAGAIILDRARVVEGRNRRTDAPQWLYQILQNSPAVSDIIRRDSAAIRAEWGASGFDVDLAA